MTWHVGTVTGLRDETPTARTLVLDVPTWSGHLAGQHVDVRLTAEDGYTAVRSYSIASAPRATTIELTIERLPDGEVSPYLTQDVVAGDRIEISAPIGRWFVWQSEQKEHVQLIAGGSGLVPLMAMLRTRTGSGSVAPFRLLYSVREPNAVYYKEELGALAAGDRGAAVTYAYTRAVPEGWRRPPGRIGDALLAEATWPPSLTPTCYVCGPSGFVEAVAGLLTSMGHDADAIRTERFGPTS